MLEIIEILNAIANAKDSDQVLHLNRTLLEAVEQQCTADIKSGIDAH